MTPLDPVAERFAAATAALGERDLLRRVDTKLLTNGACAARVLAAVLGDYAAWAVPGGNLARYRSLYFDTPDLRCFHDHRRGKRRRSKVRVRHYPDRGLTFLEVKNKRSEVLTEKHRLPLPFGEETLGERERDFLRRHVELPVELLAPRLRVEFRRLGLVGVNIQERVTVDLDIEAGTPDGDCPATTGSEIDRTAKVAKRSSANRDWRRFGDVVVLEIKQPRLSVRTPILRAVRAEHLRPSSLSKYAVATALVRPELPRNAFLSELRALASTAEWP